MPPESNRRLPKVADDRDWWTLAEWADLYGFSRNGAHAMAIRGDVPGAVKFGRRWRISKVAFRRAFHGEQGAA
jgi:Helix-turn-helix domain